MWPGLVLGCTLRLWHGGYRTHKFRSAPWQGNSRRCVSNSRIGHMVLLHNSAWCHCPPGDGTGSSVLRRSQCGIVRAAYGTDPTASLIHGVKMAYVSLRWFVDGRQISAIAVVVFVCACARYMGVWSSPSFVCNAIDACLRCHAMVMQGLFVCMVRTCGNRQLHPMVESESVCVTV